MPPELSDTQAATARGSGRLLTYAGIFVLALAVLMLEILAARVTSVIAWYHLSFFVISLAMLGMSAGAVLVFVRPQDFTDAAVPRRLTQSALAFAWLTPACLAVALSLPLRPVDTLMGFIGLAVYGGALALPFMLAGVTLTLALTRAGLPASTAYGVDLCGAALGCALVIPLLDWVDAASAGVLACAVAGVAAACFATAEPAASAPRRRLLVAAAGAVLACTLAALANASATAPPLRPAWVKGMPEDPARFAHVAWNTYSRVTVEATLEKPPPLWAGSRNMPRELTAPRPFRMLTIDGAAGTVMVEHGDRLDDHAYLDWDVTAFAHTLRPSGPAAVIGVGGGRDVIEAARAGHHPIVGVELNEEIVALHRDSMADFSRLTAIPGVELISDEARSWFVRDPRRYQVITMSLIDTWASTGAGSYTLSENGLYTVEAWQTFLDRLEPAGIFTVSRWYHTVSPGETARMLALAMEVLYRRDVADPRAHIVLLQNLNVSTLLVSPRPFSEADLDHMQAEVKRLGYTTLATPRRAPSVALLAGVWSQGDREALAAWCVAQDLDLTPPTDDRPFFFNMLKPRTWLRDPAAVDALDSAFLGNLHATQTLVYAVLVSLLLTAVTILAPLWLRRRATAVVHRGTAIAAGSYFALIGLGFMFVEIGLLSRLNVFIGHPTIALATLLGGIIFFTGVGSLASARVDLERPWLARLYPLIPVALVTATALASPRAMAELRDAELPLRALAGVLAVALPALGLGLGFPLGLRLAARRGASEGGAELGPWLWGINGACGVCASGLALGTSMVWGTETTLATGAACYLLLPLCTTYLRGKPSNP